ncbi:MAG: hypothetical protein K6D54_05935 [Bacteroidales bacterium]|nr:hypothetical protein [Bacteroidales bacterium]
MVEKRVDAKTVLFGLSFLILLGSWAITLSNNRKLKQAVEVSLSGQQQLSDYITSSFAARLEPWTQPELVSLAENNEDKICIVVPPSVCRACLTSLLFSLREEDIPEDKVLICLEPEPVIDIRELKAMGYGQTLNLERKIIPDWTTDVFVVKYNSAGWWPIYFPFRDGWEAVLKLFLNQ